MLNLITAQDSFGAAIGSAELGTMGVNLKFSTGSGSSSYYLGTTLGYYKHGQQEFKPGSELKCGAGDIEIGSGAAIMIEGNGMGAGIRSRVQVQPAELHIELRIRYHNRVYRQKQEQQMRRP